MTSLEILLAHATQIDILLELGGDFLTLDLHTRLLLYHMGELMGEKALSSNCRREVLVLSEVDVRPIRERSGM